MMRWNGKYALKIWKVKSRTQFNPDTGEREVWDIELWGDERMFCNCPASFYSRKRIKCKHIREKQEELIKEFGSLEKAIEHFRKNKQ